MILLSLHDTIHNRRKIASIQLSLYMTPDYMRLKLYQMATINTRTTAGLFTVILALILITPLCGFLFDCGCNWPWAGLHKNCNVYDTRLDSKCPWCQPLISGVLSSGLAIFAGFRVAINTTLKNQIPLNYVSSEFLIRLLLGMFAFLLTAAVTAWLASSTQTFFVWHNG